MEMWPEVDIEEPLPPHYKRGSGRPEKLRIREVDDFGTRMRRPGVSYRCTKCDKFGHNKSVKVLLRIQMLLREMYVFLTFLKANFV